MDTTELAAKLMERLATIYPERLMERYKLDQVQDRAGYMLLEEAGRKRGCLVSGGEVDLYRAAAIVLDEFRGGRIGKITLEIPPENMITEELAMKRPTLKEINRKAEEMTLEDAHRWLLGYRRNLGTSVQKIADKYYKKLEIRKEIERLNAMMAIENEAGRRAIVT